MLRQISFNNSISKKYQFKMEDSNNYMDIMTDNTIILCENTKIKNFIAREISDILQGKHDDFGDEFHNYSLDDNSIDKIEHEYLVSYFPTKIINLYNQTITITVENPFILQATDPLDIWFCTSKDNEISLIPFKEYKGYMDEWNKGIVNVYKNVCVGHYGGFGYKNILM